MADINNWAVTGHITKDAEYKTLATGKGLLTVSIANNTGYGDYKKTLFIKVQQWGERGQNLVQYLKKGTLIGCTGTLSTNEWDSKNDGTHHTDLQLDVSNIQILSSKQESTEAVTPPADETPAF